VLQKGDDLLYRNFKDKYGTYANSTVTV